MQQPMTLLSRMAKAANKVVVLWPLRWMNYRPPHALTID